MNVSHWRLALLAIALMSACTQEAPVDLVAEEAALLRIDREWSDLAAANQDFDRIVSYWSDDAVVIPPDQPPVVGKEALLEMVSSLGQIPGFAISWQSDDVQVSPDGQMAFMTGTNAVTLPDSTGQPLTTRGRGVTVWRKDGEGNWKCVLDIWNDAPVEVQGG